VLERTLEAPTDKPRIECVMAVLDEHGTLRKAQERTARILEFRGADEHRAIDVMSLFCVGIDGRPAVDQGVEERQRPVERESLRAQLEHQERSISRRLDIERDELRLVQPGERSHLGRVDGDLLPRHQLGCASRLEIEPLRAHRASARARRAHPISSALSARRSKTAAT
jgi:hypothetical protein